MNATQVEYASVIRSSGNDLLHLLDDILDLAKVESGTVTLEIAELELSDHSARRPGDDVQHGPLLQRRGDHHLRGADPRRSAGEAHREIVDRLHHPRRRRHDLGLAVQ